MIPVAASSGLLTQVVRELDAIGVAVDDLQLHRPTLDDVFLTLTGHAAEDGVGEGEPGVDTVEQRMEVGAA